MPGGNGSGPFGAGPMTGRAMGYCAGYSVPGYMNSPMGGMGRGRGRGRGFRNRYFMTGQPGWAGGAGAFVPYPAQTFRPPTKQDYIQDLQQEAEYLENDLKQIKSQLAELQAEKQDK